MYRLVNVDLTQDDWYLSLDPIDKCIYLNLIISNMTNPLGVIRNGLRLLSFTVGISVKELEARLENLKERVLYLKEENIIYIKGFVFSQAGSQKNNSFFALVKKKFDELPKDIQRKIVEFDLSLVEVLGGDALSFSEKSLSIDPPVPPPTHPVYSPSTPPHTVTVTDTDINNINNSIKNNKNILNKQPETKIADILEDSSTRKDPSLVEKIKSFIPNEEDRLEVARVLGYIVREEPWRKRLKTLEDISNYWEDIKLLYNAKPVSFATGGGRCARVDGSIDNLLVNLANSWRIE